MRIYGRENSAVVKPTNAVSATKNTLNGSTKNCSSSATIGPSATTFAVSNAAAHKVAKLISAFSSGAQRLWPTSASSAPPNSGTPRTSAISNSILLQLFHMPDVEAVELLADMEKENAENEGPDQHVERHPQFDHQRHAVGRAGGGEKRAVLHRQEADHLRHRFSAHDHRQDAPLRQHRKRDQQQQRGEQVDELAGKGLAHLSRS